MGSGIHVAMVVLLSLQGKCRPGQDGFGRFRPPLCHRSRTPRRGEGRKGVILAFQNATHIGEDLDNIEFFHRLGVRIIQLTYNSRNLLGDGCTERVQTGLSQFGVDAVKLNCVSQGPGSMSVCQSFSPSVVR